MIAFFFPFFTHKGLTKQEVLEEFYKFFTEEINKSDPKLMEFITWAVDVCDEEYRFDILQATVVYLAFQKETGLSLTSEQRTQIIRLASEVVYLFRRGKDTQEIQSLVRLDSLPFAKHGVKFLSDDHLTKLCFLVKNHLMIYKAI